MGWIGKIIGGTIGLGLGGPLGAVLGAALGHRFDKSDEKYLEGYGGRSRGQYQGFQSQQEKEMTFFVAAFSMLGKIAKADGQVSDAEVKTVEDFMDKELRLNFASKNAAVNIFRTAKNSSESFESFARQFYQAFKGQQQILELMIDVLLRVAASDGDIVYNEDVLIKTAAEMFGFSDSMYENFKQKYVKTASSHYYAVLNCSPSDDNDKIKKQYRKLVSEYHPDKIIAKGLPEEFVDFANEKFKDIQQAYEEISRKRGM
jgi:DnaJ like chaperone protein